MRFNSHGRMLIHPLPDNYQLCLKRLHGLVKRLKQDSAILSEYNSTIKKQMQQGIVERVESSEEEPKCAHYMYLPHHAVVRQDKETTKVRVVYNVSTRSTVPSLNDCLHVGPKLNMKIFDILLRFRAYDILLRFRAYRIAIIADIEKAFLMISIASTCRTEMSCDSCGMGTPLETSCTEESCDLNTEAEHQWILEYQELAVSDMKFEHWRRKLDLFQDESRV